MITSVPGPDYVCTPRIRGAKASWRRSRPSRLPRWVHRLLVVLL